MSGIATQGQTNLRNSVAHRKLGHTLKFIQCLEKRHFANIVLTTDNATDVSTDQMIYTHLMPYLGEY
uniref:hypothetical protein n=1 Tax=uncultured Acinetobacter sp. TaxID=165433 RepID=UPI002620FA1B|nr:hypothetical protein [uncultured Acinetobacter sp.]